MLGTGWRTAVIFFICACLLVAPAMARNGNGGGKGGGGGGSSQACASATTVASADSVPRGFAVGVTSPVVNCSGQKQRYYVTHTFTSACGTTATISSARITFFPQESKLVSVSYQIPSNTCTGQGQVSVTVSDRRGQLATATDDLTVTN